MKDTKFNVYTYKFLDNDNKQTYVHWAKGLKMIITKGGLAIKLDSDEIQQLVKSLPRTLGGRYF